MLRNIRISRTNLPIYSIAKIRQRKAEILSAAEGLKVYSRANKKRHRFLYQVNACKKRGGAKLPTNYTLSQISEHASCEAELIRLIPAGLS